MLMKPGNQTNANTCENNKPSGVWWKNYMISHKHTA